MSVSLEQGKLSDTEYHNRKMKLAGTKVPFVEPSYLLTTLVNGVPRLATGNVPASEVKQIGKFHVVDSTSECVRIYHVELAYDSVGPDYAPGNRRLLLNDNIETHHFIEEGVLVVIRSDPDNGATAVLAQILEFEADAEEYKVLSAVSFIPLDVANSLRFVYNLNSAIDDDKVKLLMKATVGNVIRNRYTLPALRGFQLNSGNADSDDSAPNNFIHYGNLADPFAVDESLMFDYPLAELVNLPRMIIHNVAPFAFVNEAEHSPKTMNIPYPKILFELGEGEERSLVVLERVDHMEVNIQLIIENVASRPYVVGSMVNVKHGGDGNALIVKPTTYTGGYTEEESMSLTMYVLGFIAEFQVGNTVIVTPGRTNREDAPDARTGRAFRIVRMVMGVKTVRKPWQGGTHASPREHTRIGHWRRLRNGKRQWFPEVIVNKGVIGKIDKVYHVSKKNGEE